ncbi:MAG: type II toxin-antitoxin system RelE/ParE family toxin [Nanoarchaeota archaeon]|nr:type II toxin-antitoxin system RelE/ParE family toxin [Nanoarchaeota archaeon]
MVKVSFNPVFRKIFSKIKDNGLKEKIIKQFSKIKDNPEIGKPLRNVRKGTREVYIKPFRLAYVYFKEKDEIVFLSLYHKNEQ